MKQFLKNISFEKCAWLFRCSHCLRSESTKWGMPNGWVEVWDARKNLHLCSLCFDKYNEKLQIREVFK